MSVLGVQNIGKTLDSREVLKGVSFDVGHGEIFSLIGPKGAGKSTLLKIITGLVRPDSGRVRILDTPSRSPHVRRLVGYLPEIDGLGSPATLYNHLLFHSRLLGMSPGKARDRIIYLLHVLGFKNREGTRVDRLPREMTKKFLLALAMLGSPQLLLLDEPSSGLGSEGIALFREIILKTTEEGAAVLMTASDVSELERLSSRVGLMHSGTVFRISPLGAIPEIQRILILRVKGESEALLRLFGEDGIRGTVKADEIVIGGFDPGKIDRIPRLVEKAGCRLVSMYFRTRDITEILDELFSGEDIP